MTRCVSPSTSPLRHEPYARRRDSVFFSETATLHRLPGDISAVAPPDPIPNSEVKRSCADGSVHLACESRSSPGSTPKARPQGRAFFCTDVLRIDRFGSTAASRFRSDLSVFFVNDDARIGCVIARFRPKAVIEVSWIQMGTDAIKTVSTLRQLVALTRQLPSN